MPLFSCPTLEGRKSPLTLQNPAFISDLHLTSDAPETLEGFYRFLEGPAVQYDELVILGDFFDYWVGDDAAASDAPVLTALRRYAEHHSLYLMQGNRDFMMGEAFAEAAGGTLLADPCLAYSQGRTLLLSHGDKWCTADLDYQAVRKRVRSVWWQWLVLRLPLKKRLSIAENARAKSRQRKSRKEAAVTDVVESAFLSDAQKAGADLIVHGHTHRPFIHTEKNGLLRAVLPDWHFENQAPVRGGWLSLEAGKPVLHGPEAL